VHRRAAFLGLKPGGTCLIVMPNHWQKPGSSSHGDVHTMIEVATLAHEAGCPIAVLPADGLHENNGDRTEFCIGGPTSNPRTAGHLAAYLPGVTYRAFTARRNAGAILVGGRLFGFDHGRQEHALVAKFTPPHSSRPVIVIFGQRSIDNQAAIHFLTREYRSLANTVASADQFCLIVRVASSDTYGYQATELIADVTVAAFHVPQAAGQ
jgi:hypothetical protein